MDKPNYADPDGRETVEDWQCVDGCPVKLMGGQSRFFPQFTPDPDPFLYAGKASRRERGEGNTHPTVKPQMLMRWLCRLITPPGGVILDCFMGSGSTGVAAVTEGFGFVGIEQTAGDVKISRARIKAARESTPLLTGAPA